MEALNRDSFCGPVGNFSNFHRFLSKYEPYDLIIILEVEINFKLC